jgi:hypothetical protein
MTRGFKIVYNIAMQLHAYKILLLGHTVLFFLLYISYLIEPYYFDGSGGMSNYGVDQRTIGLFTIGFIAAALSAVKAANLRDIEDHLLLTKLLHVLGVLYIVALISTYPYQMNDLLDAIHKFAGTGLLIYFLFFGFWLFRQSSWNWGLFILLLALLAGFITTTVSLLTPAVYLSHGQALMTLSFSALLIITVKKLAAQ